MYDINKVDYEDPSTFPRQMLIRQILVRGKRIAREENELSEEMIALMDMPCE